MTEELEQLPKKLKLLRMLQIYDEQLPAADKDDISYSDFVTRLVRAQLPGQLPESFWEAPPPGHGRRDRRGVA